MLLAPIQCHLSAAPESTTITLGRLRSRTATAPRAKTATFTEPFLQTRQPKTAIKHAPEAQDAQKPQACFWQGEPTQPKPASPAAPAEEFAIWEACEYLRCFVRDNWGEAAEHAAVIECEMPMARIREFGKLPERQGTRSCTRLIRIPVLAEEIGHRLWRLLSEQVALDSLATGEEDCAATAALALCRGRDSDQGQDLEGASDTLKRPQYKQCWNCHGQSKYREFEESAGAITSCYRCMECFYRFDVKTTATSVVGSRYCGAGEKESLPTSFGRRSSWSEYTMDVWRRRDPRNIKHSPRPVAEPVSFEFLWT
ncbi:hypothetical protein MGG_00561 [Pyricularia oryzae 70-15]|uniref:Uncharacterized protein n=3 Tax=Pyricularia oryzae TaxID=318829 RepID=G4NBE7_PYRO7|nr:uncharacterized protein MGG_00561 [Pyricularia oryzae 70-15]EHA48904.1 hypothetical protein MGG_00561 [Pyricularia oryzae 70-15]ELQ38910.1 hypothetical protein OOU_Y34scaffold00522g65 [Pyricularia oryzae Y34]